MISISTPYDSQQELASSLRMRRKGRRHSRREASVRSGVPEATIRRFETTGEISLRQLLMLCEVYGDLSAARTLFPRPAAQTMDELIAQSGGKS